MTELLPNSKVYRDLLANVKAQIRTARVRAALAANRELVLLYWQIGKEILTRQRQEGWGTRVIDRLAQDLRAEFPDMEGLSTRNIKYMRSLAEAWREEAMCKFRLHNCPGTTISLSLKKLSLPKSVSGTPNRPSRTAGAATSW